MNQGTFDYHPKASKLWLIVMEVAAEENVQWNRSTDHDRRKEVSGSNDFEVKFTETIIPPLVQQVSRLVEVAQTQLQAAHAACTHDKRYVVMSQWSHPCNLSQEKCCP